MYLNNSDYGYETTWWQQNKAWGGGGGSSLIYPIPYYQVGVFSPYSLGSSVFRNVPDVSLDANPSTGYQIYVAKYWYIIGGTSCVAPLWAGFTAIVNEYRSSLGKNPIGFINPAIYSIGMGPDYSSVFHDITIGTNGHYPAVPGYDLATGWGSFIGDNLLYKLGGCPLGQAYFQGSCVNSFDVPTTHPTFATSNPTLSPTILGCQADSTLNQHDCKQKIQTCAQYGVKMKW